MTPLTIMVCIFGNCFNPSQITYMENTSITEKSVMPRATAGCKVNFTGNNSYVTINNYTCEEVSYEINKQIQEKSVK